MKRGRPSVAHLSIVPPDVTGTRPTLTPLEPLKPQSAKSSISWCERMRTYDRRMLFY
jgi:hypothetical protein